MVSSALCPVVHISGSQNVYSRAKGIADHYWPWSIFFPSVLPSPQVFPAGSKSISDGSYALPAGFKALPEDFVTISVGSKVFPLGLRPSHLALWGLPNCRFTVGFSSKLRIFDHFWSFLTHFSSFCIDLAISSKDKSSMKKFRNEVINYNEKPEKSK